MDLELGHGFIPRIGEENYRRSTVASGRQTSSTPIRSTCRGQSSTAPLLAPAVRRYPFWAWWAGQQSR